MGCPSCAWAGRKDPALVLARPAEGAPGPSCLPKQAHASSARLRREPPEPGDHGKRINLLTDRFIVVLILPNETESRLREGASAYFAEFTTIEEENLGIASVYARKPYVVNRLVHGEDALFETEIVDFYRMNLVDIVEIEDRSGTVIFRGHAPSIAGDIKIDQQVIRDGRAAPVRRDSRHAGRAGRHITYVADRPRMVR